MRDEKLHAVAARSQNVKTHQDRTTFGSCDVEKVHAVVARSTFEVKMLKPSRVRTFFGSGDVEKVHAVVPRHFEVKMYKAHHGRSTWKLRCRKSARRCGAKHIPKFKKYKTHHSRTTFGS